MAINLPCMKCGRQLTPSEPPIISGELYLGSACPSKCSAGLVTSTNIKKSGMITSREEFLAALKVGSTFWFISNRNKEIIGPIKITRFEEALLDILDDGTPCQKVFGIYKNHGQEQYIDQIETMIDDNHGVFLSEEEAKIEFKRRYPATC